jgi:hypothetical protein
VIEPPNLRAFHKLIAAILISWLILLAYVETSDVRLPTFQEGGAMESVRSRCELYRRCCRPACRFVQVLVN